MDTLMLIAVCGLAAGAIVEVLKRWLWVAQRPSARVRDAGLVTLAVTLGAVAGVVAGDVLAGLAGGGLSSALVAGGKRWARRAGWAGVESGGGPGAPGPGAA